MIAAACATLTALRLLASTTLTLGDASSRGFDSLLGMARNLPKPVEILLPSGRIVLDRALALGPGDSGLTIVGSPEGTTIVGSTAIETDIVEPCPSSLPDGCSRLRRFDPVPAWDLAPPSAGEATHWQWALFDSLGLMLPARSPSTGWDAITDSASGLEDSTLVQGFFGNEYQDRILPWSQAKGLHPLRLRRVGTREGLRSPGTWIGTRDGYLCHPTGSVRQSSMPWLLKLDSTNHVEIRDVTFAQALNGIRVRSCRQIRFSHLSIYDFAGLGVDVVGGREVVIDSLSLRRLGAGGIRIGGGDRAQLQASGHRIGNTVIDSFALWNLSYRPAVSIWGVGVAVDRCTISHGPHAGIILSGNDHRVAECALSDLAMDSRDVGAIYTGRDLSYRGSLITGNTIRKIRGYGGTGGIGVYLDDLASGIRVENNRIQEVDIGILLGGGSWNTLRDNAISVARTPLVHDCRGTTWARAYAISSGSWKLQGKLATAIAGQDPLWRSRYGEMLPPATSVGIPSIENVLWDGEASRKLDPSPPCAIPGIHP